MLPERAIPSEVLAIQKKIEDPAVEPEKKMARITLRGRRNSSRE
jgi:hypothetical protein